MAIMREQQMRTRNMKTHKMPDMAIAPQEQALEEELRNAVKSNDGLKAEGLRNQLDALRKQHK